MALVQFSGLRDNTIRLYYDIPNPTYTIDPEYPNDLPMIDGIVTAIEVQADEGIPGTITARLVAPPNVDQTLTISTTDTGELRRKRYAIPNPRRWRYQDGQPGELSLSFNPRA